MREFWHIVPIGDGCTILCKDKDGNYFLNRKEDKVISDTELIFGSEQAARLYIDENLDSKEYKPEEYWILSSK